MRFDPFKPSIKPVKLATVRPRYLALLDRMQDYDVLPSTYIKQSPYDEDCLTIMQKAHLIGIPDGYQHFNARYRVRPLEIWPLGYDLLDKYALLRKRDRGNDHFKHRYLRSVIKYSRNQPIDGVTIHTTEDIKAHPNTPNVDGKFTAIPTADGFVQPDDFWGISYNGRAFMFFHEEDDRGTEPRRSNSTTRHKDLRQMVRDYGDYLADAGYQSRYGLPQVSILINTTTDPATLFEIIQEECKPAIAKMFPVKQLPDFLAEPALMPPPTAHIITEPYFRIEDGSIKPFSILETLHKTSERKSNELRHKTSV